MICYFFFSSRRRHTRLQGDWSSDVCSSDLQQRAQIRRTANDLRASGQVLGSHHVFSPSTAQEKGRTRAPAFATAGAAARASPFIRKNIAPPAPAPAAFPPSAPPPAAATARSSCAISVVRILAS